MAARIIPFRIPEEPEPFIERPDLESCVIEDLVRWAQEELESYKRASWLQLTEPMRKEKVRMARLLIERIEDIEAGRVAGMVYGD